MDVDNWLGEFLDESIPLWKADPVPFMREVLLYEPDDWQIEVARDLRDYPRVSVKSRARCWKDGSRGSIASVVYSMFPISENRCNGSNKATAA